MQRGGAVAGTAPIRRSVSRAQWWAGEPFFGASMKPSR